MSIGITDDHAELASSLRKWAAALGGPDLVRAAEEDPAAQFTPVWSAATEMGVATIALDERVGGGGGDVLDLAVAVEACAHELLPGRLLGTAVASLLVGDHPELAAGLGRGDAFAIGLAPSLQGGATLDGEVAVVLDAVGADQVLLGSRTPEGVQEWFAVPSAQVEISPQRSVDLSRRTGAVRVAGLEASTLVPLPGLTADRVRRAMLTLAAAEASGVARWCLATAVDYAGVREQFGAKIGSFQAIKHLCAEMLETAESVTAVAWDAASAARGPETQAGFAVDVAGTVALDGAVRVAQDCIQVLGGIGFTFEHSAHLYLRRAIGLRNLLGSGDGYAASLADRARSGVRRQVAVDLQGRDEDVRPEIHEAVARVAALDEADRRGALVETGLLTPHWPQPHGRGAGPVEQLVIDQELAAAGVSRPDLKIGAWAVPTILAHGSSEQQERFVGSTLLGEVTWCQLFSEPGAGSDLASLRTRAERVDGGWRLTGQKVWTSLAHEADWGICLARTDPEAPQHRGITYFLVDMASDGLDIRPLREITGDAMFNEVFLDDVFVPDSLVVGEVDNGWRLARTTLANERVAMAGTKLDLSTERAVDLVSGDTSPVDLVRVGHAVALATVCTLLGVRSTLRSLEGHGPGAESSVAKLLGVRNRQDASELVVDLLGDRVFTEQGETAAAVHEMLLTRCLSIAGGTTQILRNVAAERILGLPR
ncbi:acyl-CoA dehydrogenase [Nocardioides sp.]|uniref:acyl-CoA dehydrogenase n=1 Tax=Nocardioides sp. TaxID=35761 RepID=UPI002732BE28|nr:acyl-CoA dehydrogenase [Nocardioides sp.]MDP3893727.1 acyl-CoA dehydrogenase [Nocardioides sp.]